MLAKKFLCHSLISVSTYVGPVKLIFTYKIPARPTPVPYSCGNRPTHTNADDTQKPSLRPLMGDGSKEQVQERRLFGVIFFSWLFRLFVRFYLSPFVIVSSVPVAPPARRHLPHIPPAPNRKRSTCKLRPEVQLRPKHSHVLRQFVATT